MYKGQGLPVNIWNRYLPKTTLRQMQPHFKTAAQALDKLRHPRWI